MLAVAGGFFLAGKTPVVKHVRQPIAIEQPDMRVQNLHLIEQAEAGDEWELWAHEAEFYDTYIGCKHNSLRRNLILYVL
jgi:hypothetical protein